MRYLLLYMVSLLAGCSEQYAAPIELMPGQREAVKHGLIKAGARVTSDVPEGVYLSLRNSHIQIRDLAVTVESAPRVQSDILDFAKVTEAIAGVFLNPDESDDFKGWLRAALAREASPVHHDEYKNFRVTLARRPLRSTFTRVDPGEPEQRIDN